MQAQFPFARPVVLLHAESFSILFASCVAYHFLFPHHWIMFAALFLVPDLSLLLYMRGPSAAAAMVYNVMHSYVLPVFLGGTALFSASALLGEISLIWISHISFDRMLGYGLKYPHAFKATHMQSAAGSESAK